MYSLLCLSFGLECKRLIIECLHGGILTWQSFIRFKNLYSTPFGSLLRGALSPAQGW